MLPVPARRAVGLVLGLADAPGSAATAGSVVVSARVSSAVQSVDIDQWLCLRYRVWLCALKFTRMRHLTSVYGTASRGFRP